MLDESIRCVLVANSPPHGLEDVGSTLTAATNFCAHSNVVAVKQGQNGFNASVMTCSRGGDEAEEHPDRIVMGVDVDDTFRTVPSLP